MTIWPFAGFFPPIAAQPSLNTVQAGSGVAVKFSLGGFYGLDVIETGSPSSVQVNCTTRAPIGSPSSTASADGLQYDPAVGQYVYVWKTEKAWSRTCRELRMELIDGTTHRATFSFK